MDSIELNKIAAAVVCAVALGGGCVLAARLLVPDEKPDRTEIPIPGLRQPGSPPGNADADTGSGAPPAAAAAARGAQLAAAQHGGCHSLQRGGGVQVGPPLWGIGGTKVAANTACSGSSPAMEFPGIPNGRDRADVVTFLVGTGPAGKGTGR